MAATLSLDSMLDIGLDLGSGISLLFVMVVIIISFFDRELKLKMWTYWSLSLAAVFLSLSCLFGSGVELLENHLPLIKPWALYLFSVLNVLSVFILSVKPASKAHDLLS
ncbi:hypothetical protein [Aeromonas hydrophila]|uniref:hypothetical protein n=1 Tax=Aeromonas hydrophila TaxID=644 RepID=UPI002B4A3E83|nr:hypothetical protein [Aeromonas hydrophila]